MPKYFLTPNDWGLKDEERTTAERDESCPGWWIVGRDVNGQEIYIHDDEIVMLYYATCGLLGPKHEVPDEERAWTNTKPI